MSVTSWMSRAWPDSLKPWARSHLFRARYRGAQLLARVPTLAGPGPAPTFIIACGRSGTTLLGHILSAHPAVRYLFEPYHRWAAIDPRTDATHLFTKADAKLILRAEDVTPVARTRFHRLILAARGRAGRSTLIEKTPHNAMRIDYLCELALGARFVHIARDGVDVARSIARIAESSTYKVSSLPTLNEWWGTDEYKWTVLLRDGIAAGHFPQEAPSLSADQMGRGAYEWLVTHAEIERARPLLGDRLHELTYPALTEQPRETLRALCLFLGVDPDPQWLDRAVSMIGSLRANQGADVVLPPGMCDAFNHIQERLGFLGRARRRSRG